MTRFDYRAKQFVKAAQWREDNLDEMKQLLAEIVEKDIDNEPCVYMSYIEPYFLQSLGQREGYYILQFYVTDDHEVDPGRWIVVYDDGEIEIMDNEQFIRMFEKV